MQGRGERGRRGAGVGFWRGWGRASQLCSPRWTLRLKTRRERTRDWVNPGCGGRDSDGFGWGSVPVVLPGSPLRLGTRRERGRGGVPSCALGGCNCGWERPFRLLLGPQGSPSRGCSGGLQTTGKGTGTAWSREPSIPPSVGTFSELPNLAVAERPCLWGQGLYRSTPLLKNLRVCAVFPSSLVSAGSPRDRTLNSGRLAQPSSGTL